MATTKRKKIGRPTKAPQPGKRASLGLKVTAATKAKIEAAAEASGRTQSQEAEQRIEQSFNQEATIDALLGGRKARQIAFAVVTALERVENWQADDDAYDRALAHIVATLFARRGNNSPESTRRLKGHIDSLIATHDLNQRMQK